MHVSCDTFQHALSAPLALGRCAGTKSESFSLAPGLAGETMRALSHALSRMCCLSFVMPSAVVAQLLDAPADFRSTAELLEIFQAGRVTGGIARSDLLGASTQAGCLREAKRLNDAATAAGAAARYCAVNFYPNGLAGNRDGVGAGRCEAVQSPCKLAVSSGPASVVTAPIYLSPEDPRLPRNGPAAPSWGDAVSACANLAAYIHGVWTAGPTTTLGTDLSQLDCIGLVSHADTQYCAVNFYPNPIAVDSSGYGIAGRCEGVQAPCEAVFSHVDSIVSTAALPVDQDDGCEWTADTLPALFDKINTACCPPGHYSCERGPPTTCSSECRDIVLGAWGDDMCKEVMLDMLGETMVSFVSLCQQPTSTVHGGEGRH